MRLRGKIKGESLGEKENNNSIKSRSWKNSSLEILLEHSTRMNTNRRLFEVENEVKSEPDCTWMAKPKMWRKVPFLRRGEPAEACTSPGRTRPTHSYRAAKQPPRQRSSPRRNLPGRAWTQPAASACPSACPGTPSRSPGPPQRRRGPPRPADQTPLGSTPRRGALDHPWTAHNPSSHRAPPLWPPSRSSFSSSCDGAPTTCCPSLKIGCPCSNAIAQSLCCKSETTIQSKWGLGLGFKGVPYPKPSLHPRTDQLSTTRTHFASLYLREL